MRKYIPLLIICLLACLFIYAFYRTEKTLVNQILIALFSKNSYCSFKNAIAASLPLNKHIIYSLPEGLWVFCITVTSRPFFLKVQNRELKLVYFPLLIAVLMEIFQLLHLANGRFDIADIIFSLVFWLMALHLTRNNLKRCGIFKSFSVDDFYCLISYAIVYLAHVNY